MLLSVELHLASTFDIGMLFFLFRYVSDMPLVRNVMWIDY